MQRVIDLAREAMVTRSATSTRSRTAIRATCGWSTAATGSQFACIGVRARAAAAARGGLRFLTLKNGVPIGYVLSSALFGSAEIAYNVFET